MIIRLLLLRLLIYLLISGTFSLIIYFVITFIKNRRIKAKSEAAAKQLKADAEAAYIKKVNESLTTTFVQYSQAIKWDGKLPSVTAGNTPIIDLRK